MPRIDYYGLENEIKAILESQIDDVTFSVEDEIILNESSGRVVGIFLTERAPAPNQHLSAGRRVDYHLSFSIWCFAYSLEKSEAIRIRSELVGLVESALLQNPTLNDQVERSWLGGGKLTVMPDREQGFASGGEVVFTAVTQLTV